MVLKQTCHFDTKSLKIRRPSPSVLIVNDHSGFKFRAENGKDLI